MLITPSLGLMLMFRTNAAYDRWMRARVMLASISSKSIDLMRAGTLWIENPVLQAALVRYGCAYSRCLRWYLKHSGDEQEHDKQALSQDLKNVLNPTELQMLVDSKNKMQHLLLKLSEIVVHARQATPLHVHMEKLVCDMNDLMHSCEMIYSSPIPLMHTRHALRFLMIWLLSVPMSLYHDLRPIQYLNTMVVIPIITFIVSMLVMGIEQLSVMLEEPYSLMPLGNICHRIKQQGEIILSERQLDWNGIPVDQKFANASVVGK